MEMYLGDMLYLIMVLDNAKPAVVTHKAVKKITGTTIILKIRILYFHFLKTYKM